jgi:hypothetical protein
MINIQRIRKSKRVMSAMIGITPDEFTSLLPAFAQAWTEAKETQHRSDATLRNIGGGRKGFLKTMEDKLFFILFYAKCYPTYDLLGVMYGCNRSNACRRQFELMSLLETTLGKKLVLPQRKMRTLTEFFEAFPEAKDIFPDGTERPVQRPKDKEKQKQKYSGKKKRHTVKNIVIADNGKRIGFLGKTVHGKMHDFAIFKEQIAIDRMPKKIRKHLDLGFLGFEKQFPGHEVSIPKKKPKGGHLTDEERAENKKKSSVRILVENALSGVKRMRIVTDTFRNRKTGFDDQVMLVSCGLWNYHLTMR